MKIPKPFQPLVGMSRKDHGGEVRSGQGTVFKEVQFIKQKHVNECVDKCLEMVMAFYGKSTGEVLTGKKRSAFTGMPDSDFNKAVSDAGLKVVSSTITDDWDTGRLAAELQKGLIICFVKFGYNGAHAVLLNGVDQHGVLIQDPWKGPNIKMSLDKFKASLYDEIPNMKRLAPYVTASPSGPTGSAAEIVLASGTSESQVRSRSAGFRMQRSLAAHAEASTCRQATARAPLATSADQSAGAVTTGQRSAAQAARSSGVADALAFLGPDISPDIKKFIEGGPW